MARTIDVLDGAVRIRYTGLDRLVVLREDVTVPYEEIDAVAVGLEDPPSVWTWWRLGLAEPISGRRRGRFWTGGKRYFLDLQNPGRALTLSLRPGGSFDVVAIEADNAEELAARIRERLPRAAYG